MTPDSQAKPDRDARPLRERVAHNLRHNDDCGPGPVTWGEYLADADVLIALITPERDRLQAELEASRGRYESLAVGRDAESDANDRLRTENERLRALLADVVEGETAEEGSPQWYALRNARAELAGASDETGAS